MRLEVRDIRKSFGETEILKGISFSVESGKALGLLGRNGAGKTTTIRILMDVFHANSGELLERSLILARFRLVICRKREDYIRSVRSWNRWCT